MPTKKDSGNSTNTTKQRPFVTRLRISWLCRLVIVLAAVKIAFLASLVLAPLDEAAAPVVATRQATGPETRPVAAGQEETAAPDGPAQTADASARSAPVTLAEAPALPPTAQAVPAAAAPAADPAPARIQEADLVQNALVEASSRSALSTPHLLGLSVAYAADVPPVPQVSPPAPKIRPMDSPITPQRVVRPDEITPPAPPAPTVSPYVSPDSAAEKQAELNRREQELLALQQQMEARMNELHGLENRIQGMLQDANTTQDAKLRQLVDMYANMKPRQAARALTDMDESIAVKILTGMKSKQSGEVLSYMDPQHAARLSEALSKMQM